MYKTVALGILLVASVSGQWITGYYSAQNRILPISNIPWDKYTHIIHFASAPGVDAQGVGNGTIGLHYLTWSEIGEIYRVKHSGTKVLLCLKDNDSHLNAFAESTSPEKLALFVRNIATFVKENHYDGLDIDWETKINIAQYKNFIAQLRNTLPDKTLVMAAGDWGGLDLVAEAMQERLDQINIMCYDMDNGKNCYGFNCSWHNDALFQAGERDKRTCESRIRAFTEKGVHNAKIGVGIPFYARRHIGVTRFGIMGTFSQDTIPYRQLVTDVDRWKNQYMHYDEVHHADYLSLPEKNEFISYNGTRFMKDIVAWRKKQGFGGLMTFSIEGEYLSDKTGDARYPLSTTLKQEMSKPLQ